MKISEVTAPKKKKRWLAPSLKPWMFFDLPDIEYWIKSAHLDDKVAIKPHELELDGKTDINLSPFLFHTNNLLVQHNGKNYLPVQFNLAPKDFTIRSSLINSLIGSPKVVLGNYKVNGVSIDTLEGFPDLVYGVALIDSNLRLKSLKGLPDGLHRLELLSDVASLDGIPESLITLSFTGPLDLKELTHRCPNLTSLELYKFNFRKKDILEIFRFRHLNDFYISDSDLSTEKGGRIHRLVLIISKHLSGDRDVIACQEEIIETGLEEFIS